MGDEAGCGKSSAGRLAEEEEHDGRKMVRSSAAYWLAAERSVARGRQCREERGTITLKAVGRGRLFALSTRRSISYYIESEEQKASCIELFSVLVPISCWSLQMEHSLEFA